MNITIKTCCFFISLTMIPICAGCRHAEKNLSSGFGKSYKAAFNRQVINPDSPKDLGPVDTLPGSVGNQIYRKRYVKSLTEEKKSEESVSQELSDLD